MKTLITLIPLFPLLGFLISGLGFRILPRKVVTVVANGSVLASFVLSLIVFFQSLHHDSAIIITLFQWIHSGSLSIPFNLQIDHLSCLMLLIITGVGSLIHLYSIGYMHDDEGYNRFFSYMNLFIFFMLLLVMGGNYLVMFIGWEGVGLCSYLLIGFWFLNQEFNNAAKKAFIMNRIGDLGFLLGLFLLFHQFGTLNFTGIFTRAGTMNTGDPTLTAITLLLFVGAVGKSAQIPLYTWLPDAMAGPTPVSALIHAATMVTAGVYMVVRSNALYVLSPLTLSIIGITGLITALFAAIIAVYQTDIKKILAYSTISQLGYMFVALGAGAFTGAMFHLPTHAFFKALLFLCAGSVIHALQGEQDITRMGGLKKSMPITFLTFLIATLAISGIPPFSGFFSKDEILFYAYKNNPWVWALAVGGAMITAFYMFRLLYLTFYGKPRHTNEHIHESPRIMTIPLILLAVLSVLGGLVNWPRFAGGNIWLEHYLEPVLPSAEQLVQMTSHPVSPLSERVLAFISFGCVVTMIKFAFYLFHKKHRIPVQVKEGKVSIKALIWNKFYIDELYEKLIVRPLMRLSEKLREWVERRIIDRAVNGVGSMVIRTGNTIRYLQTGHVGFYMFAMIFGIIIILVLNLLVF